MRKLLIALAALLISVPGWAGQQPSGKVTQNQNIVWSTGGDPTVPGRDIRLVRTGFLGVTAIGRNTSKYAIFSGEAVVWDTNSPDGVTVTTTTTSPDLRFAGIAVASFETDDANGADAFPGGGNWSYIAIRGWALASFDVTGTAGASFGAHTGVHEGALSSTSVVTQAGVPIISVDPVAIPLTNTVAGQSSPVHIR